MGSPSTQGRSSPTEPTRSRIKGSFVLGKRVRGKTASLPGLLGIIAICIPLWAGGCAVRRAAGPTFWAYIPCLGGSGLPRACEQKLVVAHRPQRAARIGTWQSGLDTGTWLWLTHSLAIQPWHMKKRGTLLSSLNLSLSRLTEGQGRMACEHIPGF